MHSHTLPHIGSSVMGFPECSPDYLLCARPSPPASADAAVNKTFSREGVSNRRISWSKGSEMGLFRPHLRNTALPHQRAVMGKGVKRQTYQAHWIILFLEELWFILKKEEIWKGRAGKPKGSDVCLKGSQKGGIELSW